MVSTYTVEGLIRDEKRQPVANLLVEAFDSDFGSSDDYLGNTFTNRQGLFKIKFKEKAFKGKYEILEKNPDVYLVISDDYGVVKKTEIKSRPRNGVFKFDVVIKDEKPFYDPYANSTQRMLTLFTAASDTADISQINPNWTGALLLRSITSWLHYSDPRTGKIYGYPGPQVIARPKEFPNHDHTIPWRRTAKK